MGDGAEGSECGTEAKNLGQYVDSGVQNLAGRDGVFGAKKLSEVEGVQQQIVDIVRRLEDMGEVSTHAAEETEELIQ